MALVVLPLLLLGGVEAGLRLARYGYSPDFFKRIHIGQKDFLVNNENFSLRFFPPQLARSPNPFIFPAAKAPDVIRIFVFGESAAMGDPEPAYGPARYLEVQLRETFPGVKFEVVNVAFTAINSHVIVPIARECAQHDGDLWIIYMGNNEMVGPFGAATVFGARTPPLEMIRLNLAIQKTRLGQLLASLGRQFNRAKTNAPSWGGMQMFLQSQIAPDNPIKENVYRNFATNLDDIVRAGLGSGAKIVLNTVAVNLKDCSPFASLGNSNLPSAERAQFDRLYASGLQAEAQNDLAGAATLFGQAAALDGKFAGLQFHWGKGLLARKDFSAAREHLQLACDEDALPFRADSQINAIIAAAGRKFAGDRLALFDAATALGAPPADGVCGAETFYEHVHFDFDGSYRLGLAWARQVETMLPAGLAHRTHDWLSPKQCDERLGLPDWNRAAVWEHMAGRLQVPPFRNQPDNPQRVERLQSRVRQLVERMDADTNQLTATREYFRRQLDHAPDDFLLHENFAGFLVGAGDLPEAAAEWKRVHELIPQDYLPYYQMGRLLGGQGQWAEAEADLRAALKIRPRASEAWMDLGQIQAAQGRYSDALASYAVARQQQPQDAQPVFQTGRVYAQWNRPDAAIQCYREAIQLNPANWEPHFQLGVELDSVGQLDEARNEFAAAVKLNPDFPGGHLYYGVSLAKLGRLDEAQHEFLETLRLEPDNKNAQGALAQAQILLQRLHRN
jgi:tetratricopeptide (TPR) repeat protein